MFHQVTNRVARTVLALAQTVLLWPAAGMAQAAHVYAASSDPNDSGLIVYEVQPNGALVRKQKTPGPLTSLLAVTPGGRYLYVADGRYLTQWNVQADGTLRQEGLPVTYQTPPNYPGYPGIFALAMHPNGSYLYAATDGASIHAFRIDDTDGHLTDTGAFDCGNCTMLAMDPDGEFLFAAGADYLTANPGAIGLISSYRVHSADGSLSTTGMVWRGLSPQALKVDSRYVYVTTQEQTGYRFHALLIGTSGSLREAAAADATPFYALAPMGRYLAASASGKGSDVKVYTIANGRFQITDAKPTEVMYELHQGSGRWANLLLVTTDDGIVSFQMSSGGKLIRVGKVMIPFATAVLFVNR